MRPRCEAPRLSHVTFRCLYTYKYWHIYIGWWSGCCGRQKPQTLNRVQTQGNVFGSYQDAREDQVGNGLHGLDLAVPISAVDGGSLPPPYIPAIYPRNYSTWEPRLMRDVIGSLSYGLPNDCHEISGSPNAAESVFGLFRVGIRSRRLSNAKPQTLFSKP